MNVILIGYRGSGKTTIGKRLANQLWKDFHDVDREICKRFGIDSIADIWQTHGEPKYREVEVEVTRDLVAKPNAIIALGGGTLMQPGARAAV
ncbi:MAG: shikimate kinase, partial [Phycisphaeraceae bacterium]